MDGSDVNSVATIIDHLTRDNSKRDVWLRCSSRHFQITSRNVSYVTKPSGIWETVGINNELMI